MTRLKVPDALAGIGVERQQRIGEQIVAEAVRAVEIGRRAAGGRVHDAALLVHRHARPVVRRPAVRPGVFRPGVVAEFARMRNGVEAPAELAGAHVVGAYVARRGGQSLGRPPADDQHVLIDDARGGQHHRLLRRIASEIAAQIDAAVAAEGRDRLAGSRVQRVDVAARRGEDSPVVASAQYVTPRFDPRRSSPESNFHSSLPVPASTRSRGSSACWRRARRRR